MWFDLPSGKTAVTGSGIVTLPLEVEKVRETPGIGEVIDPLNEVNVDTMKIWIRSAAWLDLGIARMNSVPMCSAVKTLSNLMF